MYDSDDTQQSNTYTMKIIFIINSKYEYMQLYTYDKFCLVNISFTSKMAIFNLLNCCICFLMHDKYYYSEPHYNDSI